MIEYSFKKIEEALSEIESSKDTTPVRYSSKILTFTKGLFVTKSLEFIPEEYVAEVDGFLVYKSLWRTDWELSDVDIEVDNIDLFSIPELGRCDSTYPAGTPSDWDTWATEYDANPAGPFTLWSTTKALCDQIFYCTTECFCCDSGVAVPIECNKNIILVDYIGYYPERLREPDEPLETPTTAVSMKCVAYPTDDHDEPNIEAESGDTVWCKDNTVTENRNELAMNVLMEGVDIEVDGETIECDNGWHLNLNSQKCPDNQCCNCDTTPPNIGASSVFVVLGGSSNFTLTDAAEYLPVCEFTWTISGPGSFAAGSIVTEYKGRGPVTYYAPATSTGGCSATLKIECQPNGTSDTVTIKFLEVYGSTSCLKVESPPINNCYPYLCMGRVRTYNCLGTLLSDHSNQPLTATRFGACGEGAIIHCNTLADCSAHITCAVALCTSKCCYDGSDL